MSASASRSGRPRCLLYVRRHWQEQVEKSFFDFLFGDLLHFAFALAAHHVDRTLDQITHHRFDIATDVAYLGELRGLDLDERSAGQPRQSTRDISFADARGPDEDDVVRRYLFANFLG